MRSGKCLGRKFWLHGDFYFMLEIIKSRKNEAVKLVAKLVDSASFRRKKGLFVVEGARLCCDAALSNIEIISVYFTLAAQAKYEAYIAKIMQRCHFCQLVEEHVAQILSTTKSSQGVFCVCRIPDESHKLINMNPSGMYVALEQIQNPANLGAVLRTAEALGISGILLLGDCCDIYSPKALRAGMGAVFRLPCYMEKDTAVAVKQLQNMGFTAMGAVPAETAQSILTTHFSKPTVLLIGNEGNGLTETAIKACDISVTIPMKGRAESLNAATSAAILMWEMVRSKIQQKPEETSCR